MNIHTVPRQKISTKEKTEDWYKANIDFADKTASSGDFVFYHRNLIENYELRVNKIRRENFEKYINPSQLNMDKFPAEFKHVGIDNAKINVLLGDYADRKKDYRVVLSAKDEDGISRKEEGLKNILLSEVAQMLQEGNLSEDQMQQRVQQLQEWATYDYQDISEITINKILAKEQRQQNFDLIFSTTFEDLLLSASQLMYCDVLGGKPVMRRVDPRSIYTIGGGDSMYVHKADRIVSVKYIPIGQAYDDYWDVLSEKDRKKLEEGYQNFGVNRHNLVGSTSATLIENTDSITGDDLYYSSDDEVKLIQPSELDIMSHGGSFNAEGEIREVVCYWKSRRKIGRLFYLDEFGKEQITYVNEYYEPNKAEGETVEWLWVNEWMQAKKLGADIYFDMKPVPYSAKSMTNLSEGLPPIIGVTADTNNTGLISLMDMMKPFSYAYDIAFWKRELEINTFKGTAVAVNAAMIPSEWEPEEWLHYSYTDKLMMLDPTQEIMKGNNQGKSAGIFNNFVTQEVKLGASAESIQMLTDYMANIEYTMGKICGVSGAREGEIGERQAVRNTQAEMGQFAKITEKWFQVDNEFRRIVLKKFIECCKRAYKDSPQLGSYISDDLGQTYMEHFDEFAMSEYDVHVSQSHLDMALYNDLRELSHAAIQNGQARIEDLIEIHTTKSVQKVARKLKNASAKIAAEQKEAQAREAQQNAQIKQMELQDKQAERDLKKYEADKKAETDIEVALINAESKDRDSMRKSDSDKNGIDDTLDLRRTALQEQQAQLKHQIDKGKLSETVRHNKKSEELDLKKIKQQNNKPKK